MTSGRQLVFVDKKMIHPEGSLPLVLEYYICQDVVRGRGLVYGLRVDKRCLDGVLLEREETPPFTTSREEATALASMFAAGTVPPCVLLEMVDERYGLYLDNPAGIHTAREEYIA